MSSQAETVLLTGATGFLGRELVRELLARNLALRIIAMIRAPDDATLTRRLSRLTAMLPADQALRLSAVAGDVARPRLGLSPRAHDQLLDGIDRVLHGAATTRFDLSLREARSQNVVGTAEVLSICRALRARGKSGRLDHISTAYVAGDRTDLVFEEELDVRQGFRNSYERTKFEAEQLCRAARAEFPVVVHRPSIIVGNSVTGATASYHALYAVTKYIVRFYDLWRPVTTRLVPLPLRANCLIDIVPVDFVARAVASLFDQPGAASRCFHLAAGSDAAPIQRLVALASDHFGAPPLRFLRPGGIGERAGQRMLPVLRRFAPGIVRTGELFFPYTRQNPRFDTKNAQEAALVAPNPDVFFQQLIAYAYSTDFGRHTGGQPGLSAVGQRAVRRPPDGTFR